MRNKFLIWKEQRDMENLAQKEKKPKTKLQIILFVGLQPADQKSSDGHQNFIE